MFDTMTITKVIGAMCAALLIFLLGGWAAEEMYAIDTHGEDHVAGYFIETGGDDVDDTETQVVEVAFADVYATADASAGERLWRQCSACHALEPGRNGTGPYLHGIVGRAKHNVEEFRYSDALMALEGDWTAENLSEFIANPREYAPGTAMVYNGMADVEDRANLIAYLATFE